MEHRQSAETDANCRVMIVALPKAHTFNVRRLEKILKGAFLYLMMIDAS